MVTLVIDDALLISIFITLVIVAFAGLFFMLTETKSELERATRDAEHWMKVAEDYKDKMVMWKRNYEELEKGSEENLLINRMRWR